MTALISLSSIHDNPFPVLSIIDGLHQGVALSLDKRLYALGCALHCDLVLSDPGIADEHLHLRINDREVAIEARGGDVVVVRSERSITVPMGSGHRARLPVEIRIGSACLTVAMADIPSGVAVDPHSRPPLEGTQWLWVIALVLLLLGCSAFTFHNNPASDLSLTVLSPASSPVSPVLTSVQAREWLEQQLSAEGFRAITLTEAGHQLLAKGVFDPGMKPGWAALQRRFDERFGQQVILRSSVTQRADIAPPRIRFQAVWFGTDPYIINDNGKRLYPGASLLDNWVLERIDPDAVVLSRGDEHFSLTL